jgi:hypothetical protein
MREDLTASEPSTSVREFGLTTFAYCTLIFLPRVMAPGSSRWHRSKIAGLTSVRFA